MDGHRTRMAGKNVNVPIKIHTRAEFNFTRYFSENMCGRIKHCEWNVCCTLLLLLLIMETEYPLYSDLRDTNNYRHASGKSLKEGENGPFTFLSRYIFSLSSTGDHIVYSAVHTISWFRSTKWVKENGHMILLWMVTLMLAFMPSTSFHNKIHATSTFSVRIRKDGH